MSATLCISGQRRRETRALVNIWASAAVICNFNDARLVTAGGGGGVILERVFEDDRRLIHFQAQRRTDSDTTASEFLHSPPFRHPLDRVVIFAL